jgi:hypothetical protein
MNPSTDPKDIFATALTYIAANSQPLGRVHEADFESFRIARSGVYVCTRKRYSVHRNDLVEAANG